LFVRARGSRSCRAALHSSAPRLSLCGLCVKAVAVAVAVAVVAHASDRLAHIVTLLAAAWFLFTANRRAVRVAQLLFGLALFTFLVWPPLMLATPAKAGLWSEFAISWAMTAAAWVVATHIPEH
jgi:hypothetical protein